MKRKLILALMVSVLPMMAASMADAQTYSRVITFGDSLSDNGNLFAMTGSPPAPYNQRFTNRLVFTEYLTGQTTNTAGGFLTATTAPLNNTGNINYAFGGARTDSAPNSNGPIPGTNTQIATYLARGGTFGANDVVTLWGGANNIFQGPAAATAVAAAADIGAQANQLSSAGAKTIVVMNLPDLGLAPAFFGGPLQGGVTQLSGLYNSTLQAQLTGAAAAHTGTNFITVDMFSAFKAIVANPSAFGISNVTSQCILTPACVTGTPTVQDTYAFWDSVHPTAAIQQLEAKIVAQYLYTPTLASGVAMFADQSYATRHSAMLGMSDAISGATGSEGESSYFLQVVGEQGSRDRDIKSQALVGGAVATLTDKAYDYKMNGARIGMTQSLSSSSAWGVGFSALVGDASAFMIVAKPTSLSFDAGFNWHSDTSYVAATLGMGVDTFADYERSTVLSQFKLQQKSVAATSISSSVEYGMKHGLGFLNLTPVGRLSYIRSDMRSFDETGVIDRVHFAGRRVDALSAAVELRANADMGGGMMFNGLLGYEGRLSGKSQDLTGILIENTAQAFHVAQGNTANQGVLVGLGLTGTMGNGFKLSAQYRASFGDNNQKNHRAMISLGKSF